MKKKNKDLFNEEDEDAGDQIFNPSNIPKSLEKDLEKKAQKELGMD